MRRRFLLALVPATAILGSCRREGSSPQAAASGRPGFLFVEGIYMPPPYDVAVHNPHIYVNRTKVLVVPILREEEDDQWQEEMTAEEVESEKTISRIARKICAHYYDWADFHGWKEAQLRLKKLLDDAKREGRPASYRLKGCSLAFLRADGKVAMTLHLCPFAIEILGPPYRQYDMGTETFMKALTQLAQKAADRYGDERARDIVANFLASQPSVASYSFDQEEVVLVGKNGKETRVVLPKRGRRPLDREQARRRKAAKRQVKIFGKTLRSGGLVAVSGTLDLMWTVPRRRALKTVRRIRETVLRRDIDSQQKKRMLASFMAVDLAEEFVRNWRDSEALLDRLER